jgi:hypothetical protein
MLSGAVAIAETGAKPINISLLPSFYSLRPDRLQSS